MEVPKGVMPDSPQAEVLETTEEEVSPEVIQPNQPEPKGVKTPPENLYAALEEERRKRKEAEDKLYSISSEPNTTEAFSDEGKLLENKIKSLESTVNALQEDKLLSNVHAQYPELKGMSAEFDAFRADYPRTKIENAAKLFLMEKGVLNTPRKGLEKQSSGGQAPASDRLTAEEVSDLRKNNHRKYAELLMSGKIKLDELE